MAYKIFNVIALISGGKDSLFSILHCLANGHNVVALGNLYPASIKNNAKGDQIENEEDTDSFMYQTIGHSTIKHYAEALGIPLYRRPLSGAALDQSLNYTPQGISKELKDEAEDLFFLLKDILVQHAEADAVSTGAILSNYQRNRVESVAVRLGLVPLSYLWQYPYLPPYRDASLLEDMHAVGQDARIIKVASGGLDDSFLNMTVSEPKTVQRLIQRMKAYGPSVGCVLGEGGEYETLALSGPKALWKRRIVLPSIRTVAGGGGSFALYIQDAHTVSYRPDERDVDLAQLRRPPVFDVEFENIIRCRQQYDRQERTGCSSQSLLLHLPNVFSNQRPSKSNMVGTGATAEEQMQSIVSKIERSSASRVLSTTLLLRDMRDFERVNIVYSKLFEEFLPPARVTVACGDLLPQGCQVMLSLRCVEASMNRRHRRGIHVQSQSYWAPANIGPYSQAVCESLTLTDISDERDGETSQLIHVAGQIPLVPHTMQLLDSENVHKHIQTAALAADAPAILSTLALQHLWRIGRAVGVSAWTTGIAYINGKLRESSRMQLIYAAIGDWRCVHQMMQANSETYMREGMKSDDSTESPVSDFRPRLPDTDCLMSTDSTGPPAYAIVVADLPRNASVEWWSTGISSSRISYKTFNLKNLVIHEARCEMSGVKELSAAFKHLDRTDRMEELFDIPGRKFISIYITTTLPEWLAQREAQVIPCFSIFGTSENKNGSWLEALLIVTFYS